MAKDVILPFLVLASINVVLLTSMTAVAPVEWKRQEIDSRDQYGRVLATYGSCTASNGMTKWFLWSIFALNFFAVFLSNVQIYLARNLPQNLNESKEVAFSMLMLLEACLVGVPVLIVVEDSPTARFLVSTSLVVVVCLAIMVPQIPSKVRQQRHISVRSSTDANRGSVLAAFGFSRSGGSRFSRSGASSVNGSTNTNPLTPEKRAELAVHACPQMEDSVSSFAGG